MTSFASPTTINPPAIIVSIGEIRFAQIVGSNGNAQPIRFIGGANAASQRLISVAEVRIGQLKRVRNRILALAIPTAILSAGLFIAGLSIQALAPLSLFLGSLGSLAVLQMKISDVGNIG